MGDSPVNRLEKHWLRKSVPVVPPQRDEPSWKDTAKSWEENLENFMGDHPKLTLAAAATIGLVLGWLVKRK
jgi:ElaB/YqjD/DUF883 family membrane-anchored ribosome-binding protein